MDGMTVQELPEHLKQYWPVIRGQLLSGAYKPSPVKRVEIPKPDGGVLALNEDQMPILSHDKQGLGSAPLVRAFRRCWIGLSSRR